MMPYLLLLDIIGRDAPYDEPCGSFLAPFQKTAWFEALQI